MYSEVFVYQISLIATNSASSFSLPTDVKKSEPLGGSLVISSNTTTDSPNPPGGGADFMTQTDAQGRAVARPAAPASSAAAGGYGTTHTNTLTAPITTAKPPRSRILQWFCCFVGARPNDFSDEIDEYAHTPPGGGTGVGASGRSTSQSTKLQPMNRSARSSRSNNHPVHGLPQRHPHIGPVEAKHKGKKCLVLDLDETLVHSSLREEALAHMVIPVNIDNAIHDVYVIKRPGVDEFLRRMGEVFEVFVYTASLSKYADPLLDQLDTHKVISKRLFRENCVFHEGHYVKDLSLLNRDLQNTIIVDNSPMSYVFHPENAIDCGSFIDDMADIEMWTIGDFLNGISKCDDVRAHCRGWRTWCKEHPKQSTVPASMLKLQPK